MGRLTLNVLLSFAQFEREVTTERIRDKIAASKKKGLWMGGFVPLGYEANGRTLKINAEDAQTIKALYDLYLKHKLIRLVKEEVVKLELRSKCRTNAKGVTRGGNYFDRGHIYHILSNPIYAGRIRHKDKTYEGQHAAIIVSDMWDNVQKLLVKKAAYGRGHSPKAVEPSPLAGRLYDETGDRLTPSHTKKNGKRLRYYISHRLIKRSGEKDIAGWRLPASPLEEQVAKAIPRYLKEKAASSILMDPTAESISKAMSAIANIAYEKNALFDMVDKISIEPGRIIIALDHKNLTALFETSEEALNEEALTFTLPFQTRKRGVETKLIIGHVEPEKDVTLIRNLAKAHKWFGMMKAGYTFDEITKQEGTSRRRIQQIIELAFLAPDIVQMISEGLQPIGLTSEWVLRYKLPSDWQDQRALFANL